MHSLRIITALLLFWAAGAQAVTVELDFESGAAGNGYELDGLVQSSMLEGNSTLQAFWGGPGCCSAGSLTRTDGNTFSLLQMDVGLQIEGCFPFGGCIDDYRIYALDELGGTIVSMSIDAADVSGTEWRTIQFDDSWQGITTLYVSGQTGGYAGVHGAMDNVVVSAVPIPAAAWMLGSALAILGWRRKTIVVIDAA